MEDLAVCIDACKGLESVVATVWPHSEKRECFRHLMENLKKYYHGEVYGKNMWPAARAYTESKFNYFFDKVVVGSPRIVDWIKKDNSLFGPGVSSEHSVGNLGKLTSNLIQKIKTTNITEAKETIFMTKTQN
jgi:transposase-like protein